MTFKVLTTFAKASNAWLIMESRVPMSDSELKSRVAAWHLTLSRDNLSAPNMILAPARHTSAKKYSHRTGFELRHPSLSFHWKISTWPFSVFSQESNWKNHRLFPKWVLALLVLWWSATWGSRMGVGVQLQPVLRGSNIKGLNWRFLLNSHYVVWYGTYTLKSTKIREHITERSVFKLMSKGHVVVHGRSS